MASTSSAHEDPFDAHPKEDAYWDTVREAGSPVYGERRFNIGPYHEIKETDWETWQGDATERTRQLGARAMAHRQRAGEALESGSDAWKTVSHIGEETRLLTPKRSSSRPERCLGRSSLCRRRWT